MSRHVPRRRKGSTYLIAVLLMPALFGFVAMGVDWGRVAVARHHAQAAADAAAIAAAAVLDQPGKAQQRAVDFAKVVTVNGYTASVNPDEVLFGYWDGTTLDVSGVGIANAVVVTAEVTVDMPFSRLFGIEQMKARARAGAAPRQILGRAPDLVVVLDVTGSMSSDEIVSEREAAEALLDCIYQRSSPESRASIVTFTGADHTLVGMSDFGTYGADLLAGARNISGCGSSGAPPCSGTNPASGYYAALDILSRADTPEGIGQAVLLMSDGEPNANSKLCDPSFWDPAFLFPFQSYCQSLPETCTTSWRGTTCTQSASDNDIVSWTEEQRVKAEAAGVDVYTVYYGDSTVGQDFLSQHVRAGAGFSEVALTKAEIADRFIDVCLEYTVGTAGLLF